MSPRLALLAALAAAILLPLTLASPQRGGGGGGRDRAPETKLGGFMGEINGGVRKLRAALEQKEPDFEALTADVCRLQAIVIEAKNEEPATLAEISDEKKHHKAVVEFRLEMHELLRGMLDLEAALLQSDAKAAGRALRGLDKVKQEGHGKFKEDR